ncbi:MAG: peptide ABC transporter permease [Acidobacteria bacterium]|nr:MAG: peptide ABC transporter permease [Acidobacteriota bacterium]
MQLAFTEIKRAKLRFGLLTGAVGLLVFLLLFLNTLSGTLLRFFVGAIENNSAQVLVFNGSARRNLLVSRVSPAEIEQVREVPGVAEAAPLSQATVSVDPGSGPTDISLWGFEAGKPGQPAKIVEGRSPGPGEAVVDRTDVSAGFEIGNEIAVIPLGHRIKIVGYSENSRYSVLPTAYVTHGEFAAAYRSAFPQAEEVPVSLVAVDTDPGLDPADVAARITTAVPGTEALDRKAAAAAVPGVESISQSFSVILAITFAIVLLVIGFFFLILTVQKLRVLIALRAIGASVADLGKSLTFQIALVTGAGCAVGVALLFLATSTSSASFPLEVDLTLVLESTAAILAMALIAGTFSLRRVARLDPAEAAQVR